MNEVDIIEIFLTEIENEVGIPARTKDTLEDHTNKDIVIVDSWNTNRTLRATNPFHRTIEDENGFTTGEVFHFYYTMRLDLVVFSENELNCLEMKNDVASHFQSYENDPTEFHEDMVLFEVGSSSLVDPQYEPTSMRLHKANQTIHLEYADKQIVESDEVLEQIDSEITVE